MEQSFEEKIITLQNRLEHLEARHNSNTSPADEKNKKNLCPSLSEICRRILCIQCVICCNATKTQSDNGQSENFREEIEILKQEVVKLQTEKKLPTQVKNTENKDISEKQKEKATTILKEQETDDDDINNSLEDFQDQSKSTFETYKKRSGVIDSGKEYEYMMCALYALKLSTDDTVYDFEITSNDSRYGDFDDIALTIIFNNKTRKKFHLQLKHRQDVKDVSFITQTQFCNERSPFSFAKYAKTFETIMENVDPDAFLVLYTNHQTKMSNGFEFTVPESEKHQINEIKLKVKKCDDGNTDIVATPQTEQTNIFQFELVGGEDSKNVQRFCKQFYFFAKQYHINHVNSYVQQMLEKLLQRDIYDTFVNFIKSWYVGHFVLNKHDVLVKITELALDPWIKVLSDINVSPKTEILTKSIMNFEITIVQNADDNIVDNIWSPTLTKRTDIVAKKYRVEKENMSRLFWYLGVVPLVVRVDVENATKVMLAINLLKKSLKDKKVVLVGNVNLEELAPDWKILSSLWDIYESDKETYNGIVNSYYVSLQEREPILLQQLVGCDPEMIKIVRTEDVLIMSQENVTMIGFKKEKSREEEKEDRKLSESYIPRSISLTKINTKEIIRHCLHSSKCVLIIECDDNFNDSDSEDMEKFLNDDNKNTYSNVILLSRNQNVTFGSFNTISNLFEQFSVYVVRLFDSIWSTLEMYKGNALPANITQEKISIPEENIFDYFHNNINVFCAPPGMGKSTLLQILSCIYCPSDFCSIHINLINHNSFLKTEPDSDEILEKFLLVNDPLLWKFLVRKKIHLFLDGLDEVERDVVDRVLNFVKDVSSKGIYIWMSSRENLEEKLFESLHKVSIQIEELNDDQREKYIHKRLSKVYEVKDIEKITDRIFRSADVTNSQQLLGVPLQLYILTELFINKRESYINLIQENIFILTKMYRLFFEGKRDFLFKKVGVQNLQHQLNIVDINTILTQYEIPALMACLDSDDFSKLDLTLDKYESYFEKIRDDGDPLGIIKKISQNQIIFVHQTYAEYFACVWLCVNHTKVRLLQKELFSHRYQNLKLIFDIMLAEELPLHLAVIYKNFEQFDKHLTKESIKERDTAGRTVLHLACGGGVKIPVQSSTFFFVRSNRDTIDYIKIFDILMLEFSRVEYWIDKMFEFASSTYAIESNCLYPIEKMLEHKKIYIDSIYTHLCEKFRMRNLIYYSAQLGYPCLFSIMINKYSSYVNDYNFGNHCLLEVAMRGCKNDDYTKKREGNIKVVEILIKKGANINGSSRNSESWTKGSTIVDYACDIGCCDMFEILIKNDGKCSRGNNILHKTAAVGYLNEEVFKVLRNLKYYANDKNDYGDTPLHISSRLNQTKNTKILLKHGADVTILGYEKNTALHYAAESKYDNTEIIELLIQFRVDINAQNKAGKTPLHIASVNQIKNVEKLLEHNADVNIFDKECRNVLQCASQAVQPNTEIIQLLIDRNLDINVQNKFGTTPLHFACTLGVFDNMKKLIDLGADVSICDKDGNTALHYAAQCGNENVQAIYLLVVKYHVSVHSKNVEGQTPLHIACMTGVFKNIDKLLELGADVNQLDANQKNPIDYAHNFRNKTDIIDLLERHRNSEINTVL